MYQSSYSLRSHFLCLATITFPANGSHTIIDPTIPLTHMRESIGLSGSAEVVLWVTQPKTVISQPLRIHHFPIEWWFLRTTIFQSTGSSSNHRLHIACGSLYAFTLPQTRQIISYKLKLTFNGNYILATLNNGVAMDDALRWSKRAERLSALPIVVFLFVRFPPESNLACTLSLCGKTNRMVWSCTPLKCGRMMI